MLKVGIDDSIKKYCGYEKLIQLDTADRYVDLHCASIFHTVMLDGKSIDSLQWRFHYKQKTNQRGILTYLDITDLSKGMHVITIKGPEKMYSQAFAEIPFYREISPYGYLSHPPSTQKKRKEELSTTQTDPAKVALMTMHFNIV